MLKKNPEVWDDEPRFNKKVQRNQNEEVYHSHVLMEVYSML